jgi:hypothetical protein
MPPLSAGASRAAPPSATAARAARPLPPLLPPGPPLPCLTIAQRRSRKRWRDQQGRLPPSGSMGASADGDDLPIRLVDLLASLPRSAKGQSLVDPGHRSLPCLCGSLSSCRATTVTTASSLGCPSGFSNW